ncbi:hypothetical protein EV702DRAFT_1044494 [Suillus placidus]|uniref:Uncharacterized protein n=1 Tax=Suillus placidus TaxID=48579 RepID=A0A9P6ZYA2_9AGAM|nr:hypothetical protein EV702DRAFT_1044494 [Suillus placidus]
MSKQRLRHPDLVDVDSKAAQKQRALEIAGNESPSKQQHILSSRAVQNCNNIKNVKNTIVGYFSKNCDEIATLWDMEVIMIGNRDLLPLMALCLMVLDLGTYVAAGTEKKELVSASTD